MTNPITAIITVGGAVAAVLVLWGAGARVIKAVRRIVHFVDDWEGHPARPGIPGRPGMVEQLAQLGERMSAVENRTRQLTPNGGSHLADKVDQIARLVDQQGRFVEGVGDSLMRIENHLAIIDAAAAETGVADSSPAPSGDAAAS